MMTCSKYVDGAPEGLNPVQHRGKRLKSALVGMRLDSRRRGSYNVFRAAASVRFPPPTLFQKSHHVLSGTFPFIHLLAATSFSLEKPL